MSTTTEDKVYTAQPPNGLSYFENFVTQEEAEALVNFLDTQTWNSEDVKNRRTQQFGYKFNFGKRNNYEPDLPDTVAWIAIPPLIAQLVSKMMQQNIYTSEPKQVIVNEYYASQGISPHIDRLVFGDTGMKL